MSRTTNIPAVYLVLQKDNQILLSLRKNTGYEDGNFSLVSGHLEPIESLTQAMIREAQEEAGLTVFPQDLQVAHVMHRLSPDENTARIDTYFTNSKWQGEIANLEPDKCGSLDWYDLNNLPQNIVPCVHKAITSIQKKVYYSEFGWE